MRAQNRRSKVKQFFASILVIIMLMLVVPAHAAEEELALLPSGSLL
ncbi:hypothetical protein [Paenibacillus sp. FSL P4-0081]|nr:hypothetical protein [Paenibacillus sp. FSL P4-0081]